MTANIVTTQQLDCQTCSTQCISVCLNNAEFLTREGRYYYGGLAAESADERAKKIAREGFYTYVPEGCEFITHTPTGIFKRDHIPVKVDTFAKTVTVIRSELGEPKNKDYTIQKANNIAKDLGIPFVPLKEEESACSIL